MNACVNLTALREITEGDAEVEKELFRSFLDSAMECITALKAACGLDADDEWRKQAHAFKGTSLNLGAAKLGNLCKEAQDDYKAPTERKFAMLAAIETEFENVRNFLEQTIANPS